MAEFWEEVNYVFQDAQAPYGKSSNADFTKVMKRRTKSAALLLVNFFHRTPNEPILWNIRSQLLRSGTSVAANYRAACHARSEREFYAKLCIVVEETDETIFWLELLMESDIEVDLDEVSRIGKEYVELLKIFAKARATIKNQS